jgi:hypothetical protein
VKAGLVTDGPYAEVKEIIASFAIIQAADYDAALAIARAVRATWRSRSAKWPATHEQTALQKHLTKRNEK